MKLIKRFAKWVAVTLCFIVLAYVAWVIFFFAAFFYTVPKYEAVSSSDTRTTIDERKGFLISREVKSSSLGGYEWAFREQLAVPGSVVVRYGLIGASFAVIYDESGAVLAKIDDGLDG
ncbi:MAG: hypothetical protein AAGM21_13085 [Pseudomonadota bacterium]